MYGLENPRTFQDLFYDSTINNNNQKSQLLLGLWIISYLSLWPWFVGLLIWMNEWMCHRFAKNADFEEVEMTLTDPRESRKNWNFKKANEQMSIELHLKIVFLEGVKNIADFAKEVTKHYINMPLFQKATLYYVHTFLSVIGLGAGNKRRTWNKRRAWKIWKKK